MTSNHRRPTGFTLLELLMVVAIIAILASIGVPNFLEAQTRGKIARARSDMAVVGAALRAYHADYNRYPPNNAELRQFLDYCAEREVVDTRGTSTPAEARVSWTRDDPMLRSRPGNWAGSWQLAYPILETSGNDLNVLTTPIAYAGCAIPVDPFYSAYSRGEHSEPAPPGYNRFIYLNLADLQSSDAIHQRAAANQRFAIISAGPDRAALGPPCMNPANGPFIYYDPTNGTVSTGDLFHFGHGQAFPDPSDQVTTVPGVQAQRDTASSGFGIPI